MYNSEFENIKGKIAVISDESNISSILCTVKSIKDSEIDLYIGSKDSTIVVNDIKDTGHGLKSFESPVYKYSPAGVLNPFEYNAVICIEENSEIKKITEICKACATPVIFQHSNILKTKIA